MHEYTWIEITTQSALMYIDLSTVYYRINVTEKCFYKSFKTNYLFKYWSNRIIVD